MGQMTQAASEAMDDASPTSMSQLIATLKTEPTAKVMLSKPTQSPLSEVHQSIAVVGGVYKCNRCTRWHVAPASGFLIADDLLVTNYHVVNQPSHQALAVRLFDGRLFMVEEVVAASRENDLAVLRILYRTQAHFSGSGSSHWSAGGSDQPSQTTFLHPE